MTQNKEVALELHESACLTDVHVHPSLKAYLFRRNLWRHYWSGSAFNPFASRSDFKTLGKGRVGVVWAAHYLPEREVFRDCWLARVAGWFSPIGKKLTSGSQFDRLLEMMDSLERETSRHPEKTEVARSVADLDRIRSEGKLAVVHTIEGAHVLEGDPDHIATLSKRGVAMITLSHFYDNEIARHVDGIPKEMGIRKWCNFDFGLGREPALTNLGRAVLRAMAEQRMIVDVSHCTPEAREAIYAEVDSNRPIAASHVGVQRHNPDLYNLSDEEIREVTNRGGVVGVILMTYWLASDHPKNGVGVVCDTMEHIANVTAAWDSVTIGTDFDGFTDPPDDLEDASHLWKITAELLKRGVAEEDVKKVLGGNARRVLEAGWRLRTT